LRWSGGGCHSNGSHNHYATTTRAEEMGLQIGKQVEFLENNGKLMLLQVNEACLAIDRKIARST